MNIRVWGIGIITGDDTLHGNAKKGDVSRVAQLLKGGLLRPPESVNSRDLLGRTPLHWAAVCDSTELAHLLLINGADLDSRDLCGDTPLHVAAMAGGAKVGRLLIEKGAKIDTKNKVGRTPLHMAAERGGAQGVEFCLEMGAAINAKDDIGRTPLRIAEIQDKTDVVRILRARGGLSLDDRDYPGKSRIIIAR